MADDAQLGPLETQVLGLLKGTQGQAVSELQHALQAQGQDLAYTTVMTVLSRLVAKGVAERSKEGKRFLYRVAEGVPKVKEGILTRLQRSLFGSERTRPIVTLLNDKELTREELESLRAMIDNKLKEQLCPFFLHLFSILSSIQSWHFLSPPG
jgi:BlaI family transcriptional regulator, penicillinase repressor